MKDGRRTMATKMSDGDLRYPSVVCTRKPDSNAIRFPVRSERRDRSHTNHGLICYFRLQVTIIVPSTRDPWCRHVGTPREQITINVGRNWQIRPSTRWFSWSATIPRFWSRDHALMDGQRPVHMFAHPPQSHIVEEYLIRCATDRRRERIVSFVRRNDWVSFHDYNR